MQLLRDGRAQDALQIARDLVSSDDEGDRLSGYLCRGWVYEDGGTELPPDLEKSIHNYRQAALIAPSALPYCYLARVYMKSGGANGYASALRYLRAAAEIGGDTEILLGFAHYHRTKPDAELNRAKRYYLQAAARGRFMGFFGYSEVANEMGQNGRAFAFSGVRIILGPFLALLLGRRAQDRF